MAGDHSPPVLSVTMQLSTSPNKDYTSVARRAITNMTQNTDLTSLTHPGCKRWSVSGQWSLSVVSVVYGHSGTEECLQSVWSVGQGLKANMCVGSRHDAA